MQHDCTLHQYQERHWLSPTAGGEGGEEAEESEEEMLKRKPWGDTRHFCPVALAEKGVLWPGSQDYALR